MASFLLKRNLKIVKCPLKERSGKKPQQTKPPVHGKKLFVLFWTFKLYHVLLSKYDLDEKKMKKKKSQKFYLK